MEAINNSKGFKVLKLTAQEALVLGGLGICDFCNKAAFSGYYIAVLNSYYCQKCYDDFCARATYYEEDRGVETNNFKRVQETLFNNSKIFKNGEKQNIRD